MMKVAVKIRKQKIKKHFIDTAKNKKENRKLESIFDGILQTILER